MKILFIHREGLSGTGGATYAGQLIDALSARHDAHVLSNPTDLNNNWDIIHALNIKHFEPEFLKQIRAPLVVDVHDAHWATREPIYPTPDLPARLVMARMRRRKYQPILEKAARVIVHSKYVAGRIGMEKTRIVPYAVDAIEAGPSLNDRPSVVIFAGRDYFRKGLPVLLKAWNHVRRLRPGSRLEIAGREFIHGRIYARMFARHQSITLLGGISHNDLMARMRNVKALALPSWTESFGIVLIEGMAAGTPVVATNTGGMPEALREGEGGILVKPGDARSLAAALIRCIDDDPAVMSNVRRGFDIAAEHSVAAMVKAVEDVYREVSNS